MIMLLVGNQREYIYSKLKPLYAAFLHDKKLSGCRIRIKFEKDTLAIEQSNYTTKTVNDYIVYD